MHFSSIHTLRTILDNAWNTRSNSSSSEPFFVSPNEMIPKTYRHIQHTTYMIHKKIHNTSEVLQFTTLSHNYYIITSSYLYPVD